jgi:hypothetical protein
MGSEKELLEAFERIVHEVFPKSSTHRLSRGRCPVEIRGRIRAHSADTPSRPHPKVRCLLRRAKGIAAQGAESVLDK